MTRQKEQHVPKEQPSKQSDPSSSTLLFHDLYQPHTSPTPAKSADAYATLHRLTPRGHPQGPTNATLSPRPLSNSGITGFQTVLQDALRSVQDLKNSIRDTAAQQQEEHQPDRNNTHEPESDPGNQLNSDEIPPDTTPPTPESPLLRLGRNRGVFSLEKARRQSLWQLRPVPNRYPAKGVTFDLPLRGKYSRTRSAPDCLHPFDKLFSKDYIWSFPDEETPSQWEDVHSWKRARHDGMPFSNIPDVSTSQFPRLSDHSSHTDRTQSVTQSITRSVSPRVEDIKLPKLGPQSSMHIQLTVNGFECYLCPYPLSKTDFSPFADETPYRNWPDFPKDSTVKPRGPLYWIRRAGQEYQESIISSCSKCGTAWHKQCIEVLMRESWAHGQPPQCPNRSCGDLW